MKFFRFENIWLSHSNFKDSLHLFRSNCNMEGDVAFRMFSKLKLLMKEIKKWTKEKFSSIKVMKLKLLDSLKSLRL